MSANKIKWLFTSNSFSHVLIYLDKETGKKIGYCIINSNNNFMHYAYPFYDITYFKRNAGMGMMLKAILKAQDDKNKYVYLGTCYTDSSLYKLQFKGVEYFNGFEWVDTVETLKNLVKDGIKGHLIEDLDKDIIFKKPGIQLS
jgi:arginyl-tRNA--protein-N-Asp/Glu arginylyltransferase